MLEGGGSIAEWLACWTQAQKSLVQTAAATLSGNSLRQTVHIHRASVHQEAKLVCDSRYLQADCQEPGSAPEPYAR